MLKLLLTLLLIIPALSAHAAPDPALIRQLADEDSGVRISAIEKLTLEADPASLPISKPCSTTCRLRLAGAGGATESD